METNREKFYRIFHFHPHPDFTDQELREKMAWRLVCMRWEWQKECRKEARREQKQIEVDLSMSKYYSS